MIEPLINGMKLYHGSYSVVDKPDLCRCRKYKDFGRGFYLTTDFNQAKDFARLTLEKAKGSKIVSGSQEECYVSCYTYDEKNSMKVKLFQNADVDWLHCVVGHRRKDMFSNIVKEMEIYDIIGGKIANDNTNATILLYIAGAFGEVGSPQADEICISLFLPERLKDQYCFRTESALECISFQESIRV